jgi:ribosome-associated translation inhibitor RaiA
MNTQFHILGLNASNDLRRRLLQPLERLQDSIPISAAAVVLEYRRDDAPAFRAHVSLAVPGPDIHAEARDHTLEAAWLKVSTALRKQIEQRKARQDARLKTDAHLRAESVRRARSTAGLRT